MNELAGELPIDLLEAIDRVLAAAMPHAPGLEPSEVMVVGATARDLHHHALGHQFSTAATQDLDLALALRSWDTFMALLNAFKPAGNSGIRFKISDVIVDLLPFGDIEDPQGIATPPIRLEPMRVWALKEVFDNALELILPSGVTVKVPTVAGYAATKLGAWLDRHEWDETRDARDIALVIYWYGDASEVNSRIFDTEDGQNAYLEESGDVFLASAHLLGRDIASTVGEARLAELLERWPGDYELLVREFAFTGGSWPASTERRKQIIAALTRGLRLALP